MMTKSDSQFPYWIKLVILLSLGWVVIWIYRTVLTPVFPSITATFGPHSDAELGLIGSLYFFAYALSQIPGGSLADYLGRKRFLVLGFAVIASAAFLIAFSASLRMVYIASILAGIGGGAFYGVAYALSSENIPKRWRNLSTATINSGSCFGMLIGTAGGSYAVSVLQVNWQSMMIGVGIVIISLTIAYLFYIKPSHPSRKTLVDTELDNETISDEVVGYFTRSKIAAYVGLFTSSYAYFLVISWLPKFLQDEHHFTGAYSGFMASLVAISSLPGALIFSRLTDKLMAYRLWIMVFLLLTSSVGMLCIAVVNSPFFLFFSLIVYGFVGMLTIEPLLIAYVSDNSSKAKMSTSLSVFNCFGMSSSFIAPYLAGFISDKTGSMVYAFYSGAIILSLGAIILYLLTLFRTKSVSALAKG